MTLYELLVNRQCIWILKELYESEVISKKAYTVKLSALKKYMKIHDPGRYVSLLHTKGLIHADSVGNDKVISLSQKGKDFFKTFDKMKSIVETQVKIIEDKPIAHIEYELSDEEKKALFAVYKIAQEVGPDLPIDALTLQNKHQDIVYEKLEKLNLIARVKKGRYVSVGLTPSGKKVLQREISEKLK